MGKGEKTGISTSKLTTIILIVLLLALLAVFAWIHFTGGLENFFYKIRSKRKPTLQPIKPSVLNPASQMLDTQAKIKTIDERLSIVEPLSWEDLS